MQSITVNGAPQLFAPANKGGLTMTITLKNAAARYGISFDGVTVNFGDMIVPAAFVPIGFDTRVTLRSPTRAPTEGVPLVFTLQRNGTTVMQISNSSTNTEVLFEFRDLSVPVIAAIAPAQAPFRGNAILLLGVTGIPAVLTNTIRCTFGATSAQVYGVVPLGDWELQRGKYQTLLSLPDVSSFMSGISTAWSAELQAAVKATRDTALLSVDDAVAGQQAAIVLVQVCTL